MYYCCFLLSSSVLWYCWWYSYKVKPQKGGEYQPHSTKWERKTPEPIDKHSHPWEPSHPLSVIFNAVNIFNATASISFFYFSFLLLEQFFLRNLCSPTFYFLFPIQPTYDAIFFILLCVYVCICVVSINFLS